ncbi:hypothetical protein ART_0373 [Arthrobacter sp. PAMC 25486]|uniref:hypothetical protein n=1 Tax=Arthrobacter sp. PAMC 25486 TaxID=1494608 RepID=UPI000535B3B7|nr:hypothetical protein [Arthrobacter sp. PAMC 25486]AIX99971.1 hypothetical protein ART_0373 [Arthrobacter sp. PAMC 25486]
MIPPHIRSRPAGYRVRVNGHLDAHWSAWFGDLMLVHESDGTTTLSGVAPDQAALHGLLSKIRDLGITLLSVEAACPSANNAGTGTDQTGPGKTL